MKALTVQQPWAWAIIHGGKDVENRTQAWTYRGPLAIHAGARFSDHSSDELVEALRSAMDGGQWRALEFGAFVGVVDLVDAHTADWCWEPDGHCSSWAEASWNDSGPAGGRQVVHLVLENPRPLNQPLPCRGQLGLWTPPHHLIAQLEAAL